MKLVITNYKMELERMTDKELHKLKRSELLEMMIAQGKEIERLQKCLSEAEEELRNRRIVMENAGSIAEAALQLNHIFETAQQAADQYLESVRQLHNIESDKKEA